MDLSPTVTTEILNAFDVSLPTFVEGTQIANVWKVSRPDGRYAALKIYHNQDMRNERPGIAFLSALNGCGAAKVLGLTAGEVLLEWLDGPSLGDLTRDGQDVEASLILVSVANQIHSERRSVEGELPDLTEWFHELFNLQFASGLHYASLRDMLHCRDVARRFLASQEDVRPLHGDLHHDNIRLGDRGYCAFDAKGVLGEKTFELANAVRNPKGAMETVRDPERVRFLAETWSGAFGVDYYRLLEWAMVKIALSISWRSGSMLQGDSELGFLSLVRSVVDRK